MNQLNKGGLSMKLRSIQWIQFCLLVVAMISGGCAPKEQEAAAPTLERIENSSLAIAIAALPADFEVAAGEGQTIELQSIGEVGGGTLLIEATEELTGGINLVAAAEGMKDWFEQQPDGQYFGNLELGTPTGPAFTARGSYSTDGVEVEELRVFSLHPTANRMIRMTFRYPPGEGKIRMQQLVAVLGEIEAL